MHQNVSLGSNGVDRVRSMRKSLTRVRGTNFCTSSARFTPSFVRQPNGPECTQIVRNAPKRQFRVQWGGSGAFVAKKFRREFVARTFALVRPVLHQVSEGNQNISLGSNGVDQVRSLGIIPTRLHGTNICTSSARFAPSFESQPNGTECTQIVRNAPKR
jgi:hypothetical protein